MPFFSNNSNFIPNVIGKLCLKALLPHNLGSKKTFLAEGEQSGQQASKMCKALTELNFIIDGDFVHSWIL